MDLGLKDKVAVITGASAGIGKATAKAFAKEGAEVAIVARDPKRLEATAYEILTQSGKQPLTVSFDMAATEEIGRMMQHIVNKFGHIDILVNNAGASKFGDPLELSIDAFEDAIRVKYLGYVECSRAAAKHMIHQGSGRIINVIGSGGKQVNPAHLPGGAANAALILFTKGLALRLAGHNVLVNAVSPGGVSTERLRQLFRSFAHMNGISYSEAEKSFLKQYPLGRPASPEEVADIILFISSDRATYFVGSNIFMDGGTIKGI